MSIPVLRRSVLLTSSHARLYASGTAKTVKDAAGAFKKDGTIGKEFEADGAVGSAAQKVGGPFDKDGSVGKQFTSKGAVGGTGQAAAEGVQEAAEDTEKHPAGGKH